MEDQGPAAEESIEYELRLKLKSRPELKELIETLHTMQAELVRARLYVKRCTWEVPHPVHTHHVVRAIKQVEAQIAAQLEKLKSDATVEVDPPREGTMDNTNSSAGTAEKPDESAKGAFQTAWQVAKNPKVWIPAAGVAACAIGYGLYRLITREDAAPVVIVTTESVHTDAAAPVSAASAPTGSDGGISVN